MSIVRDRQWVEREYGTEKWPAVLAEIEAVLAADPGSLWAAVAAVRDRVSIDGTVTGIVSGNRVSAEASVLLGAYRSLVVDSVLRHCRPDTDLIVELGAGWGHFLFEIGERRPGPALVAGEITAAGRACIERLAPLSGRVSVAPFDHRRPHLDLPPARHAVVYTAHSVEQVDRLPTDWVSALAAMADEVTGVHLEPVGWQMGFSVGSSAGHAMAHGYNLDLVETLGRAEGAGTIDIVETGLDLVGLNDRNATSLLVWRSR